MTEREQLLAEVGRLETLRETARSAQDWDSAQGICAALMQAYRRLHLVEICEKQESSRCFNCGNSPVVESGLCQDCYSAEVAHETKNR